MRIKTIVRKILAILIPAAITYVTYPIIWDYYFTSLAQGNSANFVASFYGLQYWNNALVAGAAIVVDIIAWIFGYFVFSGDQE